PGLRIRVNYQGTTFDPSVTTQAQLDRVHTLPDPYYITNSLEQTLNSKILKFVNMPSRAIVRIYSVSGVLVQVLTLDDNAGGGELTWNLRNRNNQFVASGVYFYHVETPDGKTKVGRFTIVNFAP
ncbi:MAG: T9SS type A sorting domain-containing protein, partial [Gemmatimonadales bacterium]